jgi:hypothetical protein
MVSKTNTILSYPMEVRVFLETKMKEDLLDEEILVLLQEKFPYVENVTEKDVSSYRKKFIPNYKKMILEKHAEKLKNLTKSESEIEKEILEEVKDAKEADEEFTKGSGKKVDVLKATKVILKEMYTNYKSIMNSDDETAKKNYLVEMLKCLSVIKELEVQEKSFISMMSTVREAEEKKTVEDYAESIKSWFLLRCCERAGSKERAIEILDDIKNFIDIYKEKLNQSESCEIANMVILEKMFANKKHLEVKTENV